MRCCGDMLKRVGEDGDGDKDKGAVSWPAAHDMCVLVPVNVAVNGFQSWCCVPLRLAGFVGSAEADRVMSAAGVLSCCATTVVVTGVVRVWARAVWAMLM